MTVKIPVQADFDATQVTQQVAAFQQQLNALGAQIAQANRVRFNPIDKSTVEDLRKVTAQFEALKRVSSSMNSRINASGQKGVNFENLDWSKMYPDASIRNRKMAEAFKYVTGQTFHTPPPPVTPPRGSTPPPKAPPPPPQPPGGGGGGIVGGMANAGLRAMGPAGGVAAGALNTGMSAGFGAGLMGLVGGIAALGVGKLVGAATEKLGQAEDNHVGYDRLKRTLGDVNVSFNGLKRVVEDAANNVSITFDEAGKLSTQFAKLGNLSADQYKKIGTEIETGVGMSRAYGLDPSVGVGVLGQMRGIGVTTDEQGSRKFALLIGETIGKSGAFAKADEVMEAIAGFTVQQTRNGMGAANVGGFAGMFAGLVSSGIPGLDPAGAGGLLNKINASLSGGGSKGEASQFFTGMVGSHMGLDPIQTQILREGGAFATNDEAFGAGSVARRYGIQGPGGNQTFLQGSLGELRRQYGGNKGMLAQATSNHLGIGIRQAMALLSVDPKQMGEMEGYAGDLTKLSGSGIGNLSKALYGSDTDRQSLADGLQRRTGADALTLEQSDKLKATMAGGDTQAQKQMLAELVASRDQERTTGSDIRDSKNALDNIKTSIASQLIPLTQEMRHGIMYLAGAGKKSPREIMEGVLGMESRDRINSIEGEYKTKIDAQGNRIVEARQNEDPLSGDLVESTRKAEESARIQAEANAEIDRLTQEKAEKIAEENRLLDERILKMRADAEQARIATENANKPPVSGAGGPWRDHAGEISAPGGSTGGIQLGEAPGSVINPDGKLTRGYRNNNPGNLEASINWKGMTGSDGRFAQFATPGDGYRALGKNLLAYDKKHGLNTVRGIISRWAPPGENNTEAYIAKISKDLGVGPDDELDMKDVNTLSRLMSGISSHENGYQRHSDKVIRDAASDALGGGTAIPEGGSPGSGGDQRFIMDANPIEIIHKNERGEQIAPSQMLATSIRPASPFGTERFS